MGFGEMVLICLLALIIFGPKQTLYFAKKLGSFMRKMQLTFNQHMQNLESDE